MAPEITTVSKPKSRPPRAPVRVAFIRLRFGRMARGSLISKPSYRLALSLPNADRRTTRATILRRHALSRLISDDRPRQELGLRLCDLVIVPVQMRAWTPARQPVWRPRSEEHT